MDKSLETLIDAQRKDSRNNGDEESIPDAEFIRYNNYAQERLYNLIAKAHKFLYVSYKDISLVAGTRSYTVPDNVLADTRIVLVEYSPDGVERNFRRLPPTSDRYTFSNASGAPRSYRRGIRSITIDPIPNASTGTLRVHYERAMDRLDVRRAQVNGTPSGAVIDLTNATFGAPTAANEALFVKNTYVCVCDAFGTPMLYNGLISSYDAATDALTLAANVSTYLVGSYTLANLADGYLTLGKYTTTHSALHNICEEFIHEDVVRRVFKVDSSDDWNESSEHFKELAGDILSVYSTVDKDRKTIPIVDYEMMIPGYE